MLNNKRKCVIHEIIIDTANDFNQKEHNMCIHNVLYNFLNNVATPKRKGLLRYN